MSNEVPPKLMSQIDDAAAKLTAAERGFRRGRLALTTILAPFTALNAAIAINAHSLPETVAHVGWTFLLGDAMLRLWGAEPKVFRAVSLVLAAATGTVTLINVIAQNWTEAAISGSATAGLALNCLPRRTTVSLTDAELDKIESE